MMQLPRGLYGIADAGWGDPAALGARLAEAGCRVVQLRAKGWAPDDVAAAARAMLPRVRAAGCLLIINDHPAVAAEVGADGAHLGQEDGGVAEARRLLPPGALLGRSTHTLEQVDAAQSADYLGFGPIFGTTSKETPWAERGPELLRQAVARSRRPVVAIGGITPARLAAVRGAGAHGWAVIASLLGAPDLADAVKALSPLE